jgi:hypothetical protein
MQPKSNKLNHHSENTGTRLPGETGGLMSAIQRGLIYTHNRVNKNTSEVHRANAAVQALIEILMDKGILDDQLWSALLAEKSKHLRASYVQQGMAVAMQEFKISKYEFKSAAQIDCGNRIHLCKAVCCKLPLALSKEDIQEGKIQWELSHPYMIARNRDDYCVHHDTANCSCNVYEKRPIPCKGFDCREDKLIWLDFSERIINPAIHKKGWLEQMVTQKALADFGKK